MNDREMAVFVKGHSRDFQAGAVQGTLTRHVTDPELLATRVDFSLGLVNQAAIQYLAQAPVRALLDAGPEPLRHQLEAALADDPAPGEIGIAVTAVRFTNLAPSSELERALQTPIDVTPFLHPLGTGDRPSRGRTE